MYNFSDYIRELMIITRRETQQGFRVYTHTHVSSLYTHMCMYLPCTYTCTYSRVYTNMHLPCTMYILQSINTHVSFLYNVHCTYTFTYSLEYIHTHVPYCRKHMKTHAAYVGFTCIHIYYTVGCQVNFPRNWSIWCTVPFCLVLSVSVLYSSLQLVRCRPGS